MEDDKQNLLHQLHSPNADARAEATRQLWQMWFAAAGPEAEQRLLHAERLVESKRFDLAEAALSALILDAPTFAEAWNRRATLRYLLQHYAESLADCYEVVRLEPDHFGAWHGMGLCLLAMGRFGEAAKAFRRALEIQPFAQANQDLLAACLTKLN
jgi:tetratricopeptide (TPR) repeat protein